MRVLPRGQAGLDAINREILEEKASALGRIGEILDGHLAACERLRLEAAALDGEARATVVAKHAERRTQAKLYYWYLEVQRECMGLRSHTGMAQVYPIPKPLR